MFMLSLSSFVESELKKILTFNIANEIIGQGLDLHMFSHISLYGYNNSFLCTDFGLNLSYTFQNLHQQIHRSQHKKVNLLSYWGKNCKNCHMCAICYIYSYITDSFHVAFFLLDDRGSRIFLIRQQKVFEYTNLPGPSKSKQRIKDGTYKNRVENDRK